LLLAAWLALFQFLGNSILGYTHTPSLFLWMHEAYRSSGGSANDDAHGNFIPFLVVGLFWWKRKELLALPLKIWWPGLLNSGGGHGAACFGLRHSTAGSFHRGAVPGNLRIDGDGLGREWLRESIFPFFLFVFSVPLGARSEFITFPLRQLVSWLVEVVAHWVLGIDVIRVGTQLFDPSGTYGFNVEAPCSGMRSLIAVFLIATIYGFFVFRSPWKRLLLMALAFPLAVLGNLARMLLIIVAAEIGGQPWAITSTKAARWESSASFPTAAIIGLMIVGRLMEKWQHSDASVEQRHP